MNKPSRTVRQPNILLSISINNNAGRGILAGIFDYRPRRQPWLLRLVSYPTQMPRNLSDFDGLITNHEPTESEAAAIRAVRLATVYIDPPENSPFAREKHVLSILRDADNRRIGIIGARHLSDLGRFRSWGFVGDPENGRWSRIRERGFAYELGRHARTPSVFQGKRGLEEWLLALQKPAAVMCAWDGKALDVLTCCRKLGLAVPQLVSILGVDDDPVICDYSQPRLSSVNPGFLRLGRMAAASMERLTTSTGRAHSQEVHVRTITVRQRESTASPLPASLLIERARSLIDSESLNGLRAADVARRLGVSPSLLSLRFRQLDGTSVGELILQKRLAAVQTSLTSTQASLREIAARCGFSSANRLSHLFRARYGLSPIRWKQQQRQD